MKPLLAFLLLTATALAEEKVSRVFPWSGPDFPEKQAFHLALPELGDGPIWDIRSMPGFLTKPRANDLLLWCPASQRIFARGSKEFVDGVYSELNAAFDDDWVWVDVALTITAHRPGENTNTLFRVDLRTDSGGSTEFGITSEQAPIKSVKGRIDPVIQPDGEHIDCNIRLTVAGETVSFKTSGTFTAKSGQEKALWLSDTDQRGFRYRCTIKPTIGQQNDHPAKTSPTAYRELIKAIEARLEKL